MSIVSPDISYKYVLIDWRDLYMCDYALKRSVSQNANFTYSSEGTEAARVIILPPTNLSKEIGFDFEVVWHGPYRYAGFATLGRFAFTEASSLTDAIERFLAGEAKNLEDFKLLLKKSGIDENQVFDFLSMRPGEDVFGDINFSELENKLL